MNKDEWRWVLRNPWGRAALAMLTIAVATTAALGGFRMAQAHAKPLPRYAAGQTYVNGAFAITPLRAWVSDRQPGKPAYAWRRSDYVVLQALIENRTDRSIPGFGAPLRDVILLMPDNQPLAGKAIFYADDHLQVGDLGPRLRTRVDLVWEVPKDAAVAPRRSWGVFERAFKEKVHLNEESAWMQGDPGARLELAVEDRRPQARPGP